MYYLVKMVFSEVASCLGKKAATIYQTQQGLVDVEENVSRIS